MVIYVLVNWCYSYGDSNSIGEYRDSYFNMIDSTVNMVIMVDICWYSNLWVKIWRWVKIKDLGDLYFFLVWTIQSLGYPILTHTHIPKLEHHPRITTGYQDQKNEIVQQSNGCSHGFSHGFSHWLPPISRGLPSSLRRAPSSAFLDRSCWSSSPRASTQSRQGCQRSTMWWDREGW